jgi:putative lipoprotein
LKYSGIGGQAVIEGIMMKSGDRYATAVRKGDGSIACVEDEYISLTKKHKILALPFIRGIFAFYDSMVLGMKTLNVSASFFAEGEEEYKPGKFELWLQKTFGKEFDKIIMTAATVFSVLAGIGIFMLLPMFLGNMVRTLVDNYYLVAVLEGVLRIAIFIAYILIISQMEDIKRTFMYHGAEHKCINCIETGHPLTVENVMKSSKEHKRCGTSFLIIVMLISILFFMLIRVDGILLRALSRIVLIPVIAGVSYEFLRIAGTSNNKLVDILSKPGLWMQGLTVKEPSPDMVEVAIAAVEKVFDWKTYLEENFGES